MGIGGLSTYCLGFLGFIVNGFLHFATKGDIVWTSVDLITTYAIYAGILGLATGLASWTAEHPNKWASIFGSITAGLTLLIEFGLVLVVKLVK